MSIAGFVKNNALLKKAVHRLLIPKNEARPRLWVSLFVNPFYHKKGKGVIIRDDVRLDVLPFNKFTVGSYTKIEDYCTINNGVGDVHIGQHCTIGLSNVLIGPVTIGDHVILAQHIVASGLNHEYTDISLPISKQPVTTAPIIIEDECWIGANSVLTAGITIGKHSVVAGGSVVTKNVPPYSVVGGNPARILKQYDASINEWVRVK